MTIVFDTETNGKPLNYKAEAWDVKNWPRVVQLAWAVYDNDGNLAGTQKHLIRPDGWQIPDEVVEIHGITYQMAMQDGIPAQDAISRFISDYNSARVLVAHNMKFDYPVLLCEFLRYGLRTENKTRKVCTMEESTDFCQIPGGFRGRYKWPKLIELHQILFGEGFDGAHDALNDVLACGRCYFELLKQGVIIDY